MKRVLMVAAATTLLFACSFVRNLDYLSDGKDGGATPSSEGGTSTSSSSSSGGNDIDSGPTVGDVIAAEQYAPANLVQDATNVYWTTDDNKIMKLAKSGGQPTQLAILAGAVEQVTQLAVDSSATGSVYLLLETGIKVVPKAGGAAIDFVVLAAPMETVAIATDDTNVFLLASSDPTNDDLAIVNRYPATDPFSPPTPTELSRTGTAGTALLLTSDSVFWAVSSDDSTDVVLQVPKTAAAGAGATATSHTNTTPDQGSVIGITPGTSKEIAIDGQTFFWADDSQLKVYTQSFTPPVGKATALFASDSSSFNALVEDTSDVFVTTIGNPNPSTLLKISKVGGKPTTLNVQPNPTELALDATYLYVAFDGADSSTRTHGGILRLAK